MHLYKLKFRIGLLEPVIHNEKELLSRIAEGDENAFTVLFNVYATPLALLAQRILHDESAKQEIIQEVFLKVWLLRDRLTEVAQLAPWLKKVTLNQCLQYLRKTRRYETKLAVLGSGINPENAALHTITLKEIQQAVRDAVEAMPAQRRTIYQLSRNNGMNSREIAARLGLSDGYVRNALSAALRTIRERLPEYLTLPLIIYLLFS